VSAGKTTRNDMLSLPEVATLAGRHPEFVRQLIAAGRLPASRTPSGRWLLPAEAVDMLRAIPRRPHRRPSL
jgi:excisionase family DNA binding protein